MNKIIAVLLSMLIVFCTVGCADVKMTVEEPDDIEIGIKIGVICSGDESESSTAEHIDGIKAMMNNLGISERQVAFKYNISESGSACQDVARELADEGCSIIFGNALGYEEQMYQTAAQYPDVRFCHAKGSKAATVGLDNVYNYYAAIYQAKYAAGVVAGMKLQQMIDEGEIKAEKAKMGYVGTCDSTEVKSGYTAFFLGARSVSPTVTMEVKYTGGTGIDAEAEAARELIDGGCVLVSQHSGTNGVFSVCEEEKVYFVGCNSDVSPAETQYTLVSVGIDWGVYYTYAVKSVIDGTEMVRDWCGGYAGNAVFLTELNEGAVAPGTAEKVSEVEEAVASGELKVFDTSFWTVGGETVTATANIDGYYGNEYIIDGAFAESVLRSAPAFAFVVDGITELK